MIAQSSAIAHRRHQAGSERTQRALVLKTLSRYKSGRTNSEIAAVLGLPASTVAARINHLKSPRGGCKVIEAGRRKCRVTGYTAKVHKVVR